MLRTGKHTSPLSEPCLSNKKPRASSTASSSIHSRPASVEVGDEGQRTPVIATNPAGETKAPSAINPQPRLVGLSHPFFAASPSATSKSNDERVAEIDRVMASKQGQGKLRVLVADDNTVNVEVVSRMLKLEDVYDVTVAKDGQEAFDKVKAAMGLNQAFDIIFMDVQMPNLNGIQSTKLIRELGYTSPIVALTAFSEDSNVRDCINSGMDEFLAKPIRRPQLKRVLKKFATIPEEPETANVVAKKTTPENGTASIVTQKTTSEEEISSESEKPILNGLGDRPTPPTEAPNGA